MKDYLISGTIFNGECIQVLQLITLDCSFTKRSIGLNTVCRVHNERASITIGDLCLVHVHVLHCVEVLLLHYVIFLQNRACLAYTMHIPLEKDLDEFRKHWNSHLIRKNKLTGFPGGVPNELYEFPSLHGTCIYMCTCCHIDGTFVCNHLHVAT